MDTRPRLDVTARPCRERPRRAGLPDRNLVALAELRRGMLRGVMPSDLESRDESHHLAAAGSIRIV
jgi:hypothetical protein